MRRKTWPEQIGKQDEQGVALDAHRDEWRGELGGPHAAWHARSAVLDGERSGERGVPYAAPHAGPGGPGGGLLE